MNTMEIESRQMRELAEGKRKMFLNCYVPRNLNPEASASIQKIVDKASKDIRKVIDESP